MITTQSEQLYEEALAHIVGGVNSPSRSFKAVGAGAPIFMKTAKGAHFWDEDGNRYIDYLAAYGPIILGHAHQAVTDAITKAASTGVLYGTPTRLENDFAKLLKQAIPSLDKVRFVTSGTEAVMTTLRVARAYTGRNKIIKFAGCYHGHSDPVLVAAGSGPSTLGTPDSAGITVTTAQDMITVPYNDFNALEEALNRWKGEIAAVIIEPIVGNFGMVMPAPGFLEHVCALSRHHGSLVIYDEVISAFRFHYGAAQTFEAFPDHTAVEPDLTAMGKVIGGGMPIGAYGGKAEIMDQVAPSGPAYQAGTMAGNPASMSAGIACLETLKNPQIYSHMDHLAVKLTEGLRSAAEEQQIPIVVNRIRGSLSIHFRVDQVTDYEEACQADDRLFGMFFRGMLERGICLAPSKYEAWFLTAAHTDRDIEETIQAARDTFTDMRKDM